MSVAQDAAFKEPYRHASKKAEFVLQATRHQEKDDSELIFQYQDATRWTYVRVDSS